MKHRTPEQIARECVRITPRLAVLVPGGVWARVLGADGGAALHADNRIRRAIARAIRLDRKQRANSARS